MASTTDILNLAELSDMLSPLFDGRRAGSGLPEELYVVVRDEAVRNAKMLYAA